MESDTDKSSYRVPVRDIDEAVSLFVGRYGYRLESLGPADDPRAAILSGPEQTLLLEKSGEPIDLEVLSADGEIPAEKFLSAQPVEIPRGEIHFQRNAFLVSSAGESGWVEGRAGMRYRDLIHGRLGGCLIASMIHIPGSGPVSDYVHFHNVAIQVIYCLEGAATLVYEDQGEPFLFRRGDCVLQPPEIRHRVLESFDDLKVIEISSPAEHETFVEHKLTLPNASIDPDRTFKGQRFHWHRASHVEHLSDRQVNSSSLGLSDPSNGLIEGTELTFPDGGSAYSARANEGALVIYVHEGSIAVSKVEHPTVRVDAGGCLSSSGVDDIKLTAERRTRLVEFRISGDVFSNQSD